MQTYIKISVKKFLQEFDDIKEKLINHEVQKVIIFLNKSQSLIVTLEENDKQEVVD